MEMTITTQNFEEEVLRSEKPVLVDFWSTYYYIKRIIQINYSFMR